MDEQPTDGTDRTVRLTCFNCSHRWTVEIRKGERIGRYGRLAGKSLHADDVVCKNREGYGTCAAQTCPICGMDGPHEIRSKTTDTDRTGGEDDE